MDGRYLVYLLSIDGHLSWFHFLASVNNAAMNRDVKIFFFQNLAFSSFGFILQSGIAGSSGNSL